MVCDKKEVELDEEIWDLLAGFQDEAEAASGEHVVPTCEILEHGKTEAECAKALPLDAILPSKDDNALESVPKPQPPQKVIAPSTCEASSCCSKPKAAAPSIRKRPGRQIPPEILEDAELNAVIAEQLPSNYEFEVHRTVWKLRKCGARHIGLQLPEGLQAWGTVLADLFQRFVPTVEAATILGDVTFGACCIDDLASRALGMDFLVHYGHSCIVPVDQTTVTMLYVHVEIQVDVEHLVETIRLNFAPESRLALMGTVQFTSGVTQAAEELKREFAADSGTAKVPQVRPLGVGEVLGCTSPQVPDDTDAVIFVCDGRFHLESAMIQNPYVKQGFFRYDPFYRTLTREGFEHAELHQQRRAAIQTAKGASFVGLILGTLGRQGSSGVLEELERVLQARNVSFFTLLLSEVSPERLNLFKDVDAWVQVACPRLSMDWGAAFEKPLLTPYEAHVAWGEYSYKDVYPMDYYSNKGGPWSNYGTHNGHGGTLGTKFRHLGRRKHRVVEYESDFEYADIGPP